MAGEMSERARLGEILVRDGAITEAQLAEALDEQKSSKKLLGQILLARKFCNFEQLVSALTEQGITLLGEG